MIKTNRFILTISICLLSVLGAQSRNYYVKTDGNPALPASSWGWASSDLQAVIDKALPGDNVYVAAGVYYGGFVMKEGVNVLGGYTANVNNPTERYGMTDSEISHFSILDGQESKRVLTQVAPFTTATTWEGFLIRNGNPNTGFNKGSIIYSQTDDNIIGVLYKFNAEDGTGKMIGTLETKKQWGGYETLIETLIPNINKESANQNFNGKENTGIIKEYLNENSVDFLTEDYSKNGNYATYWCDTLTAGGYTDWYLPAPGEFQEINSAGILNVLKNVGKNIQYPYWTSAQVGNTLAWLYSFGGSSFHPALKYKTYSVSGIHDFVIPEQPNGIYFAGGGVFLSANGVLKNCKVTNNTSSSKGGGVYVGRNGQLIECVVEGNNAPEGKEIYYEKVSNVSNIENNSFVIYPNPIKSGGYLVINNSISDKLDYKIVDVSGQQLTSGIIYQGESLQVPNKKGIYFLILEIENVYFSKKLIIH